MKPKRVLFIAPPRTFVAPDIPYDYYSHRVNPCLPALTILGTLESVGWECYFVDMAADDFENIFQVSEHIRGFGMSNKNLISRIDDIQPSIILITSMFTSEFMMVDQISSTIKQAFPELPVVIGGVHPTAIINSGRPLPEKSEWLLNHSHADIAVAGEAEDSIIAFLTELSEPKPKLEKFPNLLFRQRGKIVQTKLKPKIVMDLNAPWAFKTVYLNPSSDYRYTVKNTRRGVIDSQGTNAEARAFAFYHSRGCPFACEYCATTPRDGKEIRHIGSDRMFQDFLFARKKLRAMFFINQSDTFGFHAEDRRFLER